MSKPPGGRALGNGVEPGLRGTCSPGLGAGIHPYHVLTLPALPIDLLTLSGSASTPQPHWTHADRPQPGTSNAKRRHIKRALDLELTLSNWPWLLRWRRWRQGQ